MSSKSVYLLTLSDDGSPDITGNFINLPPPTKPYTLRFAIEGASSICRCGSFWTNVPEEKDEFVRSKFREFKLTPHFNRTIHIDVTIDRPGAFGFYTTYTPLPTFTASSVPSEPVPKPTKTPTHYLTVAPNLSINQNPIPLDSLSICSVVSKWLGPAEWGKWTPQLKYISRKGYNMIHFTPLQKRGDSNSPYSLADQLLFDEEHFPGGEKHVLEIINQMEKDFGMLSLTDVVWNHTAPESKWLQEHPDAGYNLINAPWLESAYELDTALLEYGKNLESLGIPKETKTIENLEKVMGGIKEHVLPKLKLWEYYAVDVKRDSESSIAAWKEGKGKEGVEGWKKDLSLFERATLLVKVGLKGAERMGERYRRQINPVVGAAFLWQEHGDPSGDDVIAGATDSFKKVLDEINLPFYREYDAEIAVILDQLLNRIKYLRVDEHGPKQDSRSPLVESYFTRLPRNDITTKHSEKALPLANNGWIWAANPLVDFAGPDSRAYLRREVIVWGDCVKLRYGKSKEDSPYLWEHMERYTKMMAKCFHGFRIDNCHSTPLHVAEFLLDTARSVRKDLYVVAELFTGNEKMDKVYVEQLALAALIREAMQAWETRELSRIVHKHGGRPVGSLDPESGSGLLGQSEGKPEIVRKVTGSPIHALFMDCTHDNETPAQKREAKDTLPNGALVAMCDCAIGSVMGYDEVYPKLLDVVNEKRNYAPPPHLEKHTVNTEDGGLSGVPKIKRILNRVHEKMTREEYEEMHVHHEGEYITVQRVKPGTNTGYFLIAHTAFKGSKSEHRGDINPISLPGSKVKLIGAWALKCKDSEEETKKVLEDTYLRGLETEVVNVEMGQVKETVGDGAGNGEVGVTSTITVPDYFPPGAIALYETWVPGSAAEGTSTPDSAGVDLDAFLVSGAKEAVRKLDLIDLNFVLYRCESEERDSSSGRDGTYNVPGVGNVVYAGLQGWWAVMEPIVQENNLGHPACQHLRDGLWALEYIINRIEREMNDNFTEKTDKKERLEPLKAWFQARLDRIRRVPSWLRPRCFALVLGEAYIRAVERAADLMTGCLIEKDGKGRRGGFLRDLALCGVQMTGYMKNTSLYPNKPVPCMAAGLPHFSNDYMRCWGRDVFISVRGLYLATGRFVEAKEHLLAFASVLKHGMIPNLLDGGRKPRYNSRDSIWFWLQCLQDYTKMAPEGEKILEEKVKRRFLPYDDEWLEWEKDDRIYSKESTVAETVQEVFQRHASGMAFREANAGHSLDSQMKWEGFWLEIAVDWKNGGFVKGGSKWNCGTWMDKMGESETAGNKGIPGSPRDGAAVEITGMLYSGLRWATDLKKKGLYHWDSVKIDDAGNSITLEAWADKIKENFERCYYIPLDEKDDSKYDIKKDFILRRGVYKDLYGSSVTIGALDGDRDDGREDYRLRPNFLIAMVVAPDLFDEKHALKAIEIVDQALSGPYGMATLDPSDPNYRPYYINSLDSTDFLTSKGRNYHQGPEWLWPTGFFLRALLEFDIRRRKTKEEKIETFQQITRRLEGCRKMIRTSPWRGLTELTNKAGEECGDSSPTQAWSASCLVDLFWDASRVDNTL